MRWTRGKQAACVLLLFAIFTAELVHVARIYSANWDEAHHLYDGYTIWVHHDYRVNAEVPPLIKLAAALPLLPMHLAPVPNPRANAFAAGRAFVFTNGGDRVLFPARMACMLFTLLTALLIYLAAKRMFGPLAALAALLLFVFDPNVLAHGTLVSTDLGSACFLFASVYAFYLYCSKASPIRFVAAGLAVGLALVSKFTGVLIAPMLLLLVAAEALRTRSAVVFGKRLAACLGMLACGWLIVWCFYGFRTAAAPAGLELSPALKPYIASLPDPRNAAELAFAARYHLLPDAYILGLANTKKTEWEYTSYFFGKVYRHGPSQYFPAAFLIKSTLPLLILLLALPWLWLRPICRSARELCFLLIPVAVYFAVVTGSHFDIGARHLLPIYPFLYVLVSAGAAEALRRKGVWAAGAGALLAWQIVTCVRSAPAYMAYGNEAWGGPSQVHRYLSDANVDWGQQLKAVKQYLDQNHIKQCWFVYFPDGAVEPSDYGVNCRRLPTANTLSWIKLPMVVPPVIDGTVLISDSDLEGIEFGDGSLNPYQSFKSLQPAAVIQGGVDVYQGRFAIPLASALVAVRTSQEQLEAGKVQAAFDSASGAVSLAPGSARTQLALADVLLSQAQWGAALEHYSLAASLIHSVRPDLVGEELLPRAAAGLAAARAHLLSAN